MITSCGSILSRLMHYLQFFFRGSINPHVPVTLGWRRNGGLSLVLLAGLVSFFSVNLYAVSNTVVVMPFSDTSKNPQAGWISEGIPQLLQEYLGSRPFNLLGRNERLVAFDRIGIPYASFLSKASLIKVGMELDAAYLVLGAYSVTGGKIKLMANVLDLGQASLSRNLEVEGELTQLQFQTLGLAWQVIRMLEPGYNEAREDFSHHFPSVPLPALENYIKGLLEAAPDKQRAYFIAAEKASPGYPQVLLELGKLCFRLKEYQESANWLRKMDTHQPGFSEAAFLLGTDSLLLKDYEKAIEEFTFLEEHFPLGEVLSNLGIALSRMGKNDEAAAAFRKGLTPNATSADQHFNLGYHYWRTGNFAGVLRECAHVLRLEPLDAEAYFLQYRSLQSMGKTAEAAAAYAKAKEIDPIVESWEARAKVPDLFRVQTRFDAASYQQVQLEIQQLLDRKKNTGTVGN